MQRFKKEIFKMGGIGGSSNQPGTPKPTSESHIETSNNSCQTMWEGTIVLDQGVTGTFKGEILLGDGGGGLPGNNGVKMYIGTKPLISGQINHFTVELGNSGQTGVASTYKLTVTTSLGENIVTLFTRNDLQSPYWDKAPC